MALPSTFWDASGGDWEDIKKTPDISSASVQTYNFMTADEDGLPWYQGSIQQLGPLYLGGDYPSNYDDDLVSKNGNREMGFAVIKNNITGDVLEVEACRLFHKFPGYSNGEQSLAFPYSNNGRIDVFYQNVSVSTNDELHLYVPFWWMGDTAAEVIGSIAAWLYHDANTISTLATFIDTDNWDDTYDGQLTYGAGAAKVPIVYRREPGQTVLEAIKSIARHSWDLLSINMRGQLSYTSRRSPGTSATISSLSYTDGVVSISWRYAREYLANTTIAAWGSWITSGTVGYRSDAGTAQLFVWRQNCSPVAVPSGYTDTSGDYPWKKYSNANSVSRYGDINPGTSRVQIVEERDEVTLRAFHLPYIGELEPDNGGADGEQALDDYMDRIDEDAKLRREITIVQDLLGTDYDVGYKVEDVELNDSVTVSDTFCISKTVNFDDFSVTSVLLEEPS